MGGRSRPAAITALLSIVASACATADSVVVPAAQPPSPTTPVVVSDPLRPAGTTDDVVDADSDSVDGSRAEPDDSTSTIAAPPGTTEPPSTSLPETSTTTPPPTELPPPTPAPGPPANPDYSATVAAFDRLARSNAAAQLSVVRGGELVVSLASGSTLDGQPATADSPMVVASVSKLVVAMGIARLDEQGLIDIDEPVPWNDLGLTPNMGWAFVTVRELLDHTSGLPKARFSWFTGEGDCPAHVSTLLAPPPNRDRGRWVYSNGNYCILGLLVSARTGLPLDAALQQLVFDPIGVDGVHLTDDGLLPTDVDHPDGVARLSRLGGAGTLIVSTDDTALMLGRATPADLAVLQPPGVFTDQYGFGHTGTIDGAKACIWMLEDGATVISATIAGNSVSAGGGVCDLVVPAVATDLGIGAGRPDRTP